MLKAERFEALQALVPRWIERRHVEEVAARSIQLWLAFEAVFLNIAGFFRRSSLNETGLGARMLGKYGMVIRESVSEVRRQRIDLL